MNVELFVFLIVASIHNRHSAECLGITRQLVKYLSGDCASLAYSEDLYENNLIRLLQLHLVVSGDDVGHLVDEGVSVKACVATDTVPDGILWTTC